ncbi:uncharacterized protein LOC113654818 isoform X1 [Tachysurus fulvidraco]|uniref:uncharacterized protein LOC113654818 isoform X1 n=1 Tax=Tachysurus fulvidraco TaxID=1234273 RepID=UPI001FEEBA11|nr:uncharacterized protein LOC113654818 isoform X1 [Tachysurus fulvidraco]
MLEVLGMVEICGCRLLVTAGDVVLLIHFILQFLDNTEVSSKKLKLLIKDKSAIKACSPSGSDRYSNTCVLDTVLTTFHIAYICCPNVADLLNRNDFFREVISLLNNKKYDEARKVCVTELNHGKVDLFGNVEEYFPLFAKLVWPERSPNDCKLIRELKKFGRVFVLGDPSDPPLILVPVKVPNVPCDKLPPNVNDEEKKRNFACIFLLMGKDKHMTMCFQSSENEWHLYDNDPNMPSFQPFDPDHFINYMICLAVYVNITQLEEYKVGIAETGEGVGLSNEHGGDPSKHFYPQQSVADIEMEDLSCPVFISDAGGRLGVRPFKQSCPDFWPNFSIQEQQEKDIEMLSFSSSDFD